MRSPLLPELTFSRAANTPPMPGMLVTSTLSRVHPPQGPRHLQRSGRPGSSSSWKWGLAAD